jgi:hypothetical protein
MATILESLKSVSGYPVPEGVFAKAATLRGLTLGDEATEDVFSSAGYRLAEADVLKWVSFAPNIHQADVSYDILYSDRQQMRERANAIYGELGDAAHISGNKTKFGYKGNRL